MVENKEKMRETWQTELNVAVFVLSGLFLDQPDFLYSELGPAGARRATLLSQSLNPRLNAPFSSNSPPKALPA